MSSIAREEVTDLADAKTQDNGRGVTKEQLVSNMIIAAHGDRGQLGWLPVHHGTWSPRIDLRSTTSLLNWIDDIEERADGFDKVPMCVIGPSLAGE